MNLIKKFNHVFAGLLIPIICLIVLSIYAGSFVAVPMWDSQNNLTVAPRWSRPVEPFESGASPITTDISVLSSFNDGTTKKVSSPPSTASDTIIPLPATLKASLPPGTMQVIDAPAAVTSTSVVPPVPFPTLTGTNVPLVDPKATILPLQPPDVTNVINNARDPISSSVKFPAADRSTQPLPVSSYDGTASLPPALAASDSDTAKPYADKDRQSYDLQRYGPLFDELNDVSRTLTDNVSRLQNVTNKIRTQYVPNYPLPLMEVNAGY